MHNHHYVPHEAVEEQKSPPLMSDDEIDQCYQRALAGDLEALERLTSEANRSKDMDTEFMLATALRTIHLENKALEWYQKSAMHGHGDAALEYTELALSLGENCIPFLVNLIHAYRYGLGVERDEDVVDELFDLAAQHGYTREEITAALPTAPEVEGIEEPEQVDPLAEEPGVLYNFHVTSRAVMIR